MLNRIIRILATVSGCALLMAGCTLTLDPVVDKTPDTGKAIGFTAGSALLRDDATKSVAYYDDTSFGVFCFRQTGAFGWSDLATKHWKPDFMFNQEVHNSSSVYTYSPTRFWPDGSVNTLTFWAYSPYDASADLLVSGSTSTAYTSNSEGLPDIRFTVDGHTDVLYSDVVEDQTYASNSGVVPISFNHALSLVDVNVKKDDPTDRYTVTLKSLRLDGLFTTAILRSSGWAAWSGERSNLAVYEDDPDDDSDDIVLTTGNQALQGVMPLPQDLGNEAARLHVEFTISGAGIAHERTTAREVLLSTVFEDASGRWDMNSHYTLNITISPDDPIEFTVSWSDWGDVYNWHLTS